ncbi:MAG: hypothetical protein Q4B81_00090 [Moraxella sp.]|nr:hypothetical protein [Moraxella sp.]
MSRVTKLITYNLKDRGRKYAGQDRSNLDVASAINYINSDVVQELVNTGDLYGFYGHEVRALYGMTPPDTVISDDGREIRIAPAIRTVALSADDDGNVSHRQEFLENEAGEYAYQQYKAKIGGFSSAMNFMPMRDGRRQVTGFFGFDYVRNPNYATNTSYGQFDNLNPIAKNALKQAIIAQYDNMGLVVEQSRLIDYYQQEALNAQNALQRQIQRQERIKQRQDELTDSLICPSVPFDEYVKSLGVFDGISTNLYAQEDTQNLGADKERQSKLGRLLRGGW